MTTFVFALSHFKNTLHLHFSLKTPHFGLKIIFRAFSVNLEKSKIFNFFRFRGIPKIKNQNFSENFSGQNFFWDRFSIFFKNSKKIFDKTPVRVFGQKFAMSSVGRNWKICSTETCGFILSLYSFWNFWEILRNGPTKRFAQKIFLNRLKMP